MANLNVNTKIKYSNLLGSLTKSPMLLLVYCDQLADQMEDYLNGIDEYVWCSIRYSPFHASMVEVVSSSA